MQMNVFKHGAKVALRPFFRPYMARMRAMIHDELEQCLQNHVQQDIIPPPPRNIVKPAEPYRIDPYFFSELSLERKKQLFIDNVQYILLETHSYCNRKCWFCPNVHLDRHSVNKYMDDNLYRKILYEIAEIDAIYNVDLQLACYNEPLADEEFPEKVRQAKILLPNAKIHINTNGDYLTSEILHQLHKAGLSRILVSVYIDSYEPGMFTYEKALQAVLNMNKKLNIDAEIITASNELACIAVTRYGGTNTDSGMYVLIHSENHSLITNYRGGAVPDTKPTPRCDKRELMCIAPFTQFNIYYDGQATICSNLRPDYPGHQQFISGNINNNTIFDVFFNEISTRFRKELIYDLNSLEPCRHCVDNIERSPHYTLVEL
jgi:MoaA/NifB/PqqE/SkfB family radical SAM enzyme